MKLMIVIMLLSIASVAAAEEPTPDLVLADDKPAVETDAPPLVRIEAGDQPDLAFADASDPNPGSGFGQVLAGWIATSAGTAGVVQASTCGLEYNHFDVGQERRCRNLGIAVGVIGLTLGIPWLVFGYQKRHALREWKQRHGLTALPALELAGDSLRFRF